MVQTPEMRVGHDRDRGLTLMNHVESGSEIALWQADDVYAVADALEARGIPFIFISGFTQKQMPPGYRKCPYIAKPFVPDALLAKVVGERRF